MIGRRFLQHFLLFAFALCLVLLGSELSASADTTTRAARLTYLQGTVTISQVDNTAGEPAQLNMPLLKGVQLSTGQDGQAEVEFEDGSVVRLTPNSVLSLDSLAVDSDDVFTTDLTLLHGLAYLELRATPQYRYSLSAGGDVVSPVENATIRVDFDESPAIFSVLDGTAHVERIGPNTSSDNAGYQTDVRAGESLRGDPADPNRYFLTQVIAGETWDQWNQELDNAAAAEAANSTSVRDNYAGAQGYGWSDLDANGSWYDVPGQGQVWQPQAAVDDSAFDPYGNGAWVSYSGTGYVWASAYPWGWTPYRCGNWSYMPGFGWGWLPGSGCGGRGWGFAGGGRPVNIVLGPSGYKPIHVPNGGHSPARPILPVGMTSHPRSEPSRSGEHGPRQIAGMTVRPIQPAHRDYNNPGSTAVGSSLRRDYPVDSQTRTPVLGLAGTRPVIVNTSPGPRPMDQRPPAADRHVTAGGVGAERSNQPQRPVVVYPPNSGQSFPGHEPTRPTQGVRSDQQPSQIPRPVQPSSQPQHTAPPPAEHPTYSPPPASVHPSYSPPPAAPAPQRSAPAPAPAAPASLPARNSPR